MENSIAEESKSAAEKVAKLVVDTGVAVVDATKAVVVVVADATEQMGRKVTDAIEPATHPAKANPAPAEVIA